MVVTTFLILPFKVRTNEFFVASQFRVAPHGKEIRPLLERIVCTSCYHSGLLAIPGFIWYFEWPVALISHVE